MACALGSAFDTFDKKALNNVKRFSLEISYPSLQASALRLETVATPGASKMRWRHSYAAKCYEVQVQRRRK